MNKNVKIAKQLVKIAKSLIARYGETVSSSVECILDDEKVTVNYEYDVLRSIKDAMNSVKIISVINEDGEDIYDEKYDDQIMKAIEEQLDSKYDYQRAEYDQQAWQRGRIK